MQLLLIDTCGSTGSVALADTSLPAAIIAAEVLPGRSASEQLIRVIRSLLLTQSWNLAGLSAIAVVHGPGSFTGVRVGLSAAKGLSEAAGVPLIAISRLAVLARSPGYVRAVLDAGRTEFYYGEYRDGSCITEALLTRDELLATTAQQPVTFCEERVAEALQSLLPLHRVAEPTAADALNIAIARAQAEQFDDAAIVDANYLRRTDAQLFARPKLAPG